MMQAQGPYMIDRPFIVVQPNQILQRSDEVRIRADLYEQYQDGFMLIPAGWSVMQCPPSSADPEVKIIYKGENNDQA